MDPEAVPEQGYSVWFLYIALSRDTAYGFCTLFLRNKPPAAAQIRHGKCRGIKELDYAVKIERGRFLFLGNLPLSIFLKKF